MGITAYACAVGVFPAKEIQSEVRLWGEEDNDVLKVKAVKVVLLDEIDDGFNERCSILGAPNIR